VWDRDLLAAALQEKLSRKDAPEKVKGGPYERYFLVIVTDEGFLYRENVAQFLGGMGFRARFVTDAYLGLSYHPDLNGQGSCPVFSWRSSADVVPPQ
jgi:hypothetical protein